MTSNSVTSMDRRVIEAVLRMGSGYVLNFTNRTFSEFFADCQIDIDKEFPNGSKAKRLRAFLYNTEPALAAEVLEKLLVYRGAFESDGTDPQIKRYKEIVMRLRGTQVAPIVKTYTDVLSLAYVAELDMKAESRLANSDLEGAITLARTMLEAVLNELELQLLGARGEYHGDLQRHFKTVAKQLRMDEERKDLDDNFKQVVRGLIQIVNGLAPIRNKMSDGHSRERKPEVHHARVIVNASKTISIFLIESFLFQRERGYLPNKVSSKGVMK